MDEKIVFLGTPDFAAVVLKSLLDNGYNVIAVVTQPDKYVGRKKILTYSPVKQLALLHNIVVYQPQLLKNDYSFLETLAPDLLITCAYGQILPQKILDIAKINNINVHASLLPLLRGGAPIHRAIIDGHTKTGITIMKMINKMDAGVMYAQKEFEIPTDMNTSELFKALAPIGAQLLVDTLPAIIDNSLIGMEQDENEVTYAFNIKREEEKINFNQPASKVYNTIRGLSEVPGGYCFFQNKVLKIYQTQLSDMVDNQAPGTLKVDNKKMFVKCSDKYLQILSIQLEGKKKTQVSDFLNGKDEHELEKIILK